MEQLGRLGTKVLIGIITLLVIVYLFSKLYKRLVKRITTMVINAWRH